jgi:endo-alpha-1,4-polygalactosaminidase (GH114 family)
MSKKIRRRILSAGLEFMILLLMLLLPVQGAAQSFDRKNPGDSYGVFVGAGPEKLSAMLEYETVVLDAQFFSPEDMKQLHQAGCRVFSYINVGSVENFRPYYQKYRDITIGAYENWDEEKWVDISRKRWQKFILQELAPAIRSKGVDGLFVDNTDVYYFRHNRKIYDGLVKILRGLKNQDTEVCINGGDCFVSDYLKRGGKFHAIADAVNQESVFGKINWDEPKGTGRFGRNTPEERKYFQNYIERVAKAGGDIYLIEYTADPALIRKIRGYCRKHGFACYITDDLELK